MSASLLLVASLASYARAEETGFDLRWRGAALADLPNAEAALLESAVRIANPANLTSIESVTWLERSVTPAESTAPTASDLDDAPRHLLQIVGRHARFATAAEPGTAAKPALGVVIVQARLPADASDLPEFKVVRESPIASLDLEIGASLADRLTVVSDDTFGFIRLYPAGVGAIDQIRRPGEVASLTPLTELGRISRASSHASLKAPSWARGKPYLPFEIPWVGKEHRWYVETRVAFHIWQGRTFSRGFNSYGCITLRDQDLDELADIVFAHERPLPLRIRAAAFADHEHPFPYETHQYWQLQNLGSDAHPVLTRGMYYAIEKVAAAPPAVADMVGLYMAAERHHDDAQGPSPVAINRFVGPPIP